MFQHWIYPMKCTGWMRLRYLLLFCMMYLVLPTNPMAQDESPVCLVRVESVQGSVRMQADDQGAWQDVKRGDCLLPGATIRVEGMSRAAVVLQDHTLLRLDQESYLRLPSADADKPFWLELKEGAAHFFSRTPRQLKVATPFVNALIEGTEFLVRVGRSETFLTIFEGQILAANDAGRLILTQGQSARVVENRAPVLAVVADPRESVQWTLYYPPIFRPDLKGPYAEAWNQLNQNDPKGALERLETISAQDRQGDYYLARASLLLTAGRAAEATADLDSALNMNPHDAEALALKAILAVVQSRKDEALELAQEAVSIQPDSASVRLAISYARQARFDVEGALKELQEGVIASPENALIRARLAELYLSVGELGKALEAAEISASLDPHITRTQTVLGFARLTQINTQAARQAFETAMKLDPADPLPRLGLGLAIIRDGDIAKGRKQIEVAVVLDPGNALIRSYLGKAYFEEKRDQHAASQYFLAKELDPEDPTPWLYNAIRMQTENRPVEALQDLQRSIELNDNRAVYRSRLLLDEDLAARSASLGRIYRDLGFEQLALVEGWKSVNTDPANFSAHRLLADSYSALPNHDIARVSEILQSQLLQPINLTPIQSQLSESKLGILEGAGPSEPSFNEFTPLFKRDQFSFQANGVAGGNDTIGDDLTLSGLYKKNSFSLGQFHYETDGFRENNDQDRDLYNVFYQVSPWYHTSILTEFRSDRSDFGDLPLRFNPEFFSTDERHIEESDSLRLGVRHSFSPQSDIIATIIYEDTNSEVANDLLNWTITTEGYHGEAQYLFHSENLNLTTGFSHFESDEEVKLTFVPFPPETTKLDIRHTNLYLYSVITIPDSITWTIGGSGDFFDGDENVEQFNPKLGFSWDLYPSTTIRAAAFSNLGKSFIADQTIEPTQVAGFTQFLSDLQLDDIWRFGAAVDHSFSERLFSGIEVSKRDIKTSYLDFDLNRQWVDWEEELTRIYVSWTPLNWLSINMEYQREYLKRPLDHTGEEQVLKLETHKIPLSVMAFCPYGITTELKTTYVNQEGLFDYNDGIDPEGGSDRFWTTDLSFSYRFPKRFGLLSIDAKNIFDEDFQFQSMDKGRPKIIPERLILFKLSISF